MDYLTPFNEKKQKIQNAKTFYEAKKIMQVTSSFLNSQLESLSKQENQSNNKDQNNHKGQSNHEQQNLLYSLSLCYVQMEKHINNSITQTFDENFLNENIHPYYPTIANNLKKGFEHLNELLKS